MKSNSNNYNPQQGIYGHNTRARTHSGQDLDAPLVTLMPDSNIFISGHPICVLTTESRKGFLLMPWHVLDMIVTPYFFN